MGILHPGVTVANRFRARHPNSNAYGAVTVAACPAAGAVFFGFGADFSTADFLTGAAFFATYFTAVFLTAAFFAVAAGFSFCFAAWTAAHLLFVA